MTATRVLVIDDEAPIRLLCRVNLEAEGMEVLEAADGPSGLEEARERAPDVVLLDVMMPGLDGWRVAEQLLEDEGVGIPQSEQERIFRKFYRGGDASSGTGLGLFIAQGLVSAMGGHITVHSEEGKGSQFTFDLPAAELEGGSAEPDRGIAAGSRGEST